MKRAALTISLLVISACSTTPTDRATGPDCRPMRAHVALSCWYGGRDAPMSRCEVGLEDPTGCDIGPSAIAYFNSGLDMSGLFSRPDRPDRPRWVQFNVYRDAQGRVGRKFFRGRQEQIFEERRFQQSDE